MNRGRVHRRVEFAVAMISLIVVAVALSCADPTQAASAPQSDSDPARPAAARAAAATRQLARDAFDRYSTPEQAFPLLAPHTYGDGFGAGRGHQGQDVFAKCGSPIVAARAGTVQARDFEAAAGHYVVIDGKGTGQDYVYMHMLESGRPAPGSHVDAGDKIGIESDTGDAEGCHLHFEIWTSPGWYEGGQAKSPTAALKRWDATS